MYIIMALVVGAWYLLFAVCLTLYNELGWSAEMGLQFHYSHLTLAILFNQWLFEQQECKSHFRLMEATQDRSPGSLTPVVPTDRGGKGT